ncbi:MAG: glycosyltransferase, partial [Actinomycetota bacterium]
MLLAWTLTCLVALGLCTVALLLFGSHLHFSSRIVGFICLLIVIVGSGQVTAAIWKPPTTYILQAEVLLAVVGVIVIALRPVWNPAGHIFFACFIGAALAFLVFVTSLTFTSHLGLFGLVASLVLLLLEILALTISTYFTFESLDSTIRTKTTRPPVPFDQSYQPRVSLQVAAYNEPPDMLIETIKSLDLVDYRNLEIVVIDNNTQDEATWRPVEEFCRDLPRVHFFHVDGVEGFK